MHYLLFMSEKKKLFTIFCVLIFQLLLCNNTFSRFRIKIIKMLESMLDDTGHDLKLKTFHKPTYCHHCSDLLWGLTNQGLQCSSKFVILVIISLLLFFFSYIFSFLQPFFVVVDRLNNHSTLHSSHLENEKPSI